MTPDWSAQAEPVPYAKLDNPQSLNLYTYVLNNPVSSVDKDGHCPWCYFVAFTVGEAIAKAGDFYERHELYKQQARWLEQDEKMKQFAIDHPNSGIDPTMLQKEEDQILYINIAPNLAKMGGDVQSAIDNAVKATPGASTNAGKTVEKSAGQAVKVATSVVHQVSGTNPKSGTPPPSSIPAAVPVHGQSPRPCSTSTSDRNNGYS